MTSFCRVIDIVVHGSADDGLAKIALEDDYHHFRVSLRLREQQVTDTCSTALRTPYTLCADAGEQLQKLKQAPVNSTPATIQRHTDARLQCTHQLDMAGLALAAAARHCRKRRYQIEVPRHQKGHTEPRLWRDNELLLKWSVTDNILTGPPPYTGVALGKGLARWAIENFDSNTAEAIMVLRRATMISLGRLRNLDLEPHAVARGNCYVQQPDRATQAVRVQGSTLDFSHRTDALCNEDQVWLNTERLD